MAKNEQSREANQPVWFDGKSINEALFCDDFLGRLEIEYYKKGEAAYRCAASLFYIPLVRVFYFPPKNF